MESIMDTLRVNNLIISNPSGFASDIAAPLHKIHNAGLVDTRIALWALWVAAAGVIIALVAALITNYYQKRQERNALKGVLEDLLRNFRTTEAISRRIDLDTGIPSSIHFGKFKLDDVCLVFDPETCKNIKRKYLPMFNRLRLKYRNNNIEMDAACEYLKRSDFDKDVMKKYLEIARNRQNELYGLTAEFLDKHYKGKYDEPAMRPEHEEGFVILYEKLY
jgi:hypothetical protein